MSWQDKERGLAQESPWPRRPVSTFYQLGLSSSSSGKTISLPASEAAVFLRNHSTPGSLYATVEG